MMCIYGFLLSSMNKREDKETWEEDWTFCVTTESPNILTLIAIRSGGEGTSKRRRQESGVRHIERCSYIFLWNLMLTVFTFGSSSSEIIICALSEWTMTAPIHKPHILFYIFFFSFFFFFCCPNSSFITSSSSPQIVFHEKRGDPFLCSFVILILPHILWRRIMVMVMMMHCLVDGSSFSSCVMGIDTIHYNQECTTWLELNRNIPHIISRVYESLGYE